MADNSKMLALKRLFNCDGSGEDFDSDDSLKDRDYNALDESDTDDTTSEYSVR